MAAPVSIEAATALFRSLVRSRLIRNWLGATAERFRFRSPNNLTVSAALIRPTQVPESLRIIQIGRDPTRTKSFQSPTMDDYEELSRMSSSQQKPWQLLKRNDQFLQITTLGELETPARGYLAEVDVELDGLRYRFSSLIRSGLGRVESQRRFRRCYFGS